MKIRHIFGSVSVAVLLIYALCVYSTVAQAHDGGKDHPGCEYAGPPGGVQAKDGPQSGYCKTDDDLRGFLHCAAIPNSWFRSSVGIWIELEEVGPEGVRYGKSGSDKGYSCTVTASVSDAEPEAQVPVVSDPILTGTPLISSVRPIGFDSFLAEDEESVCFDLEHSVFLFPLEGARYTDQVQITLDNPEYEVCALTGIEYLGFYGCSSSAHPTAYRMGKRSMLVQRMDADMQPVLDEEDNPVMFQRLVIDEDDLDDHLICTSPVVGEPESTEWELRVSPVQPMMMGPGVD